MNRNEIKAATDAFLDELITLGDVYVSHLDKQSYCAVRIGGIHVATFTVEGSEKMVAKLKTKIGKAYNKHIKQLMEGKDE